MKTFRDLTQTHIDKGNNNVFIYFINYKGLPIQIA